LGASSGFCARGDELEYDYPYGVVRQLFERALRTVGDSEAALRALPRLRGVSLTLPNSTAA
jgi:hypothetical protein